VVAFTRYERRGGRYVECGRFEEDDVTGEIKAETSTPREGGKAPRGSYQDIKLEHANHRLALQEMQDLTDLTLTELVYRQILFAEAAVLARTFGEITFARTLEQAKREVVAETRRRNPTEDRLVEEVTSATRALDAAIG
jgi:hypothetical protein